MALSASASAWAIAFCSSSATAISRIPRTSWIPRPTPASGFGKGFLHRQQLGLILRQFASVASNSLSVVPKLFTHADCPDLAPASYCSHCVSPFSCESTHWFMSPSTGDPFWADRAVARDAARPQGRIGFNSGRDPNRDVEMFELRPESNIGHEMDYDGPRRRVELGKAPVAAGMFTGEWR